MVGDEDASWAWLCGEVGQLGTSVDESRQAVVAEASVHLAGVCWRANCHAEALEYVSTYLATTQIGGRAYGLESSDGLLFDVVPAQIVLSVIDSNTASRALGECGVVHHRNAVV